MKKANYSIYVGIFLCAALVGCAKKKAPTNLQSPSPATDGSTATDAPISAIPGETGTGADLGGSLPVIYFEYDQSSLTQEARTILQSVATGLKTSPGRLSIEGHCDDRGSNEYNLALGESRARAVRDYLRKLGVPADRLATVSFGEEKPADIGTGEGSWTKNRRAELVTGK